MTRRSSKPLQSARQPLARVLHPLVAFEPRLSCGHTPTSVCFTQGKLNSKDCCIQYQTTGYCSTRSARSPMTGAVSKANGPHNTAVKPRTHAVTNSKPTLQLLKSESRTVMCRSDARSSHTCQPVPAFCQTIKFWSTWQLQDKNPVLSSSVKVPTACFGCKPHILFTSSMV